MVHHIGHIIISIHHATTLIIVAPELSTIRNDLQMDSSLGAVLVLSAFVLGPRVLGPLVLGLLVPGLFVPGPLSEIFGRIAVLHVGTSF
jgi:hypothetical protein